MSTLSPYLKLSVLLFIPLLFACSDRHPVAALPAAQASAAVGMDVYKSESCECCNDWITHLDDNGFSSSIHHPENLNAVKREHGIDPRFQSCHTAISSAGYVFEGHVPAKFVQQFLAKPPADAIGLAVPGMPVGSPGMEIGDRFDPYAVLLLKKDGSHEVFAQVNGPQDQ